VQAGEHSSGDEGFDVACLLLGTAAHLLVTDDAISCLQGREIPWFYRSATLPDPGKIFYFFRERSATPLF